MKNLHGTCLCGAVRYEVQDSFDYMVYCYCSECRKISGSAFLASGGVPRSSFSITAGQERLRYYVKSEATTLAFCEICGSMVFADKVSLNRFQPTLGTLIDAPSQRPEAHVYAGSKARWHEITDDVPQFDGLPPQPLPGP